MSYSDIQYDTTGSTRGANGLVGWAEKDMTIVSSNFKIFQFFQLDTKLVQFWSLPKAEITIIIWGNYHSTILIWNRVPLSQVLISNPLQYVF